MEWVETTGRTVADAKEAALDQLGVDESDAEFEVLEEPRSGLFGRVRSERGSGPGCGRPALGPRSSAAIAASAAKAPVKVAGAGDQPGRPGRGAQG